MDYPYIDDIGFIDGRVTPVQKHSICQYIEQMCWRGADFYEGDIVRCFRRNTLESFIAFVVSDACIIEDGFGRVFSQDTLDYEIIGNVIDNPELLSEKSKKWIKNYGWDKEREEY